MEQLTRRRPTSSPAVVLAIVCSGVVLASLDLFIVNVALPQIARELHGTLSGLSWVLNAYAIVFAAFLVPFGRLADRSGRTGGFLLGVAVFTAGSACCALAGSVAQLVAWRVVQALGAALLLPTSLGLVLAAYPPERRGGAVRTWAAMGGVAAALGPVLGGLLVTVDWRWVFVVNVPVGLVALVVGIRWLPRQAGTGERRPDAFGAVLLTGAIAAVTLGLVRGGAWGWGSARTLGVLAVAGALATGVAARSRRRAGAVLDPALLRVRSFSATLAVALLFSAAFGALLLSSALWLQDDWGWSALATGLALVPGPVMVPLFTAVAGRLLPRFGPGPVLAAGCLVFGAGMVWRALAVGAGADYAGTFLPSMVVTGIGVGLTLPTLFSTAAASLPPDRFATGSAVVTMVRQVGMALGVAVLVAVLGTPRSPAAALAAFDRVWVVTAVVAGLGAVVALAALRPAPAPARPLARVGPRTEETT